MAETAARSGHDTYGNDTTSTRLTGAVTSCRPPTFAAALLTLEKNAAAAAAIATHAATGRPRTSSAPGSPVDAGAVDKGHPLPSARDEIVLERREAPGGIEAGVALIGRRHIDDEYRRMLPKIVEEDAKRSYSVELSVSCLRQLDGTHPAR